MSVRTFLRRLRHDEQGAFLLEVLVCAVLVLVLVGGAMAAVDYASSSSQHQRAQAVAANKASAEIERLRSLKFADIDGIDVTHPVSNIDGTKYTVRSQTGDAFTPQAIGSGCDDSTANPEAVRATVTVSWSGMGKRKPVTVSSLIASPPGGDASRGVFSVLVTNAAGVGVNNLSVQLQGPSNASGTTDDNGCVRFIDLLPGTTYRLKFQRTDWFETPRFINAIDDPVQVVAGQTRSKTYQYDPGGKLTVRFFTKKSSPTLVASKAKAVTWEHNSFAGGVLIQRGADAQTWTTALSYPTVASPYGVYADDCTNAKPVTGGVPAAVGVPSPSPSVQPGNTVDVQLPALNVIGQNGDANTQIIVLTDNACLNMADLLNEAYMRPIQHVSGTPTYANWRIADPGFPFGRNFVVCARRSDGRYRLLTSGIHNVNYSDAGTTLNVGDLATGTLDLPGKTCGN